MGCDIHMYAEVRKNKKWGKVGNEFKNTYNEDVKTDQPYSGRNYELFAFLADVRNRFDIKPIAETKGWPEDVSAGVKEDLVDYWDGDGHSASWFTLKELKEADWNQAFRHGGVVASDVYEYCKSIEEPPKSYSQGVGGGNIQTVSEEEWAKMEWSQKMNGTRWYVHMFWDTTVKDECKQFIEETIPALEKLGDEEDVRVVFTFDN